MTYQTEQVQALISEIDRALRQPKGFRFWAYLTRFRLQNRTLERVRNFLVMQQRPPVPAPPLVGAAAKTPPPAVASLASLNTELEQLRLHLVQPLQTEITRLSQQRDSLLQEVRTLEIRKAQLEAPSQPILDRGEIERLQALRDRTDSLLTSMDTSLDLALTSLQRNLDTYQESLAQGIDRMHGLGHQGEVLFSSLINHLAQQLGREASSYIHPPQLESMDPTVLKTVPPTATLVSTAPPRDVPSQSPPNQVFVKDDDAFASPIEAQPGPKAEGVAAAESDTIHNLSDLFNIWGSKDDDLPSPGAAEVTPSEVVQTEPDQISMEDLTLSDMDDLFIHEPSIVNDDASRVTMDTLFESADWLAASPTEAPVSMTQPMTQPSSAPNVIPPVSDRSLNEGQSDDLTLDEIHAIFADIPSVDASSSRAKSDRAS